MTWEQKATNAIDTLIAYAFRHELIEQQDAPYFRNLLLDVMKMDAPAGELPDWETVPEYSTALRRSLYRTTICFLHRRFRLRECFYPLRS